VLENYEAGHITAAERDAKLTTINRDIAASERALIDSAPVASVTPEYLAERFKVLRKWPILDRDERRKLLTALSPQILCESGKVTGLRLNAILGAACEPLHERSGQRVGRSDHNRADYCTCRKSAGSLPPTTADCGKRARPKTRIAASDRPRCPHLSCVVSMANSLFPAAAARPGSETAGEPA